MPIASGLIFVALSLLGAEPAGKWLGQDGHDVVGSASGVKPSDIQDIHIVLGNLPPRGIASLRVMGHGADEWRYPGQGTWTAVIQRKPGARTADLFLEPTRVEKGRSFEIQIEFDGGTKTTIYVRGGKADPNLRMPGEAMLAKWVGQERQDWAGPDAGVGPDGLQDVRIALSKISTKARVDAAELHGPTGMLWCSGVNPKGAPNAELIRDEKDPSRGNFFFQPDRDLTGKALKLIVMYDNGRSDTAAVAGGKVDPRLRMPRLPLPTVTAGALKAQWLGQDGAQEAGPGTVHVALTGLPARSVAAVVLSDAVRGSWRFRENDQVPLENESDSRPLFVRLASGGRADLFFSPYRDESGTTMTIRLVHRDGTMTVAQFPGGRADPALRAPVPPSTSTTAKPGDNLQDLVDHFGTVRLSKGTYVLTRPLVLAEPVNLVGERGAVLQFNQPAADPPWATALKIHRGGTTLKDFAIRFAGPVRWDKKSDWGYAVIGGYDIPNTGPPDPKVNLTFQGLDVESPPAADPKAWELAPHILRLVGTEGGVIAQNTFRGGALLLFRGPWRIEGNEYRGTPPGTYCDAVISTIDPHDMLVRDNRAQPVGPSGKTWRFLVMAGHGANDRFTNNTVIGIGARDDDTIPWSNAPEIVLSEAYALLFEGKPSAVSNDGRVLRIGRSHVRPPQTGDVVAVLAGKAAGQWRRITQAINGTTFLLDQPLSDGADVVSIVAGFVDATFQKNTIDGAGANRSTCFQFSGNHFGMRLEENRFAGAGYAGQVQACATEAPVFWGWTHAAFFDARVTGNVFEDADQGALFAVLHGKPIKTSHGRIYMTITLRDNAVRWTDAFLARRNSQGAKPLPPGLTIGSAESSDPAELRVAAQDNRLDAPASAAAAAPLVVSSAVFNGETVVKKTFSLPRGKDTAQVGRRDR